MKFSDLDIFSEIGETGQTMEEKGIKAKPDSEVGYDDKYLCENLDDISLIDEDSNIDRNENSIILEKVKKENKKVKKRVMFKCGASLVMIREIPPRTPSLDSESSEESESESETSEEESTSSDSSSNSKVNTDTKIVKKPTYNRISRIIREPPITMRDIKTKETAVKRPPKKRLTKKIKRESIHREPMQNKAIDKPTLKPKQIQLKMPEKELLNDNKPNKGQIKRKKVHYIGTENNLSKSNPDCKNSKITLTERLGRKPVKSLLEKRKNDGPKSLKVSGNFTEHSEISDISQTSEKPLSQSDKRLYSWLLANGRIPGPDQSSPCISPMWDTKHSGFTFWENKQTEISNKSIVKAPT